MNQVIFPLTYVPPAICPNILAMAIKMIILPMPLIPRIVEPVILTVPLHLTLIVSTCVYRPIYQCQFSIATRFIVLKLALIDLTSLLRIFALTVGFATYEFPFVDI